MKYNKKMFLEYASAFDYTEDFHYSAEQNGKPITWEQAEKENDEYMKSMENWSLKDFQEHFEFRKFDIDENEQANKQRGHKMKKRYRVIKEFFVDAHDEYDAETKANEEKSYNDEIIDVQEVVDDYYPMQIGKQKKLSKSKEESKITNETKSKDRCM